MAMSLPLPQDALPAPSPQHGAVDSNNSSLSVSSNSNDTSTTSMNDQPTPQIPPSSGAKRKPSRRANTAERRATHNAVERQRRETLNGRFLDLAALLPNLSQIRRPSKSSIVNSSIAHIQASRRHRLVAARELKMLKHEADALRREVNEWRDRAGLPRVDEPVRSDAFGMVITGELEVIHGITIEEEDEDGDDGFGVGIPMGTIQSMPHPPQQQPQQYNHAYVDDVEEEVAMLGAMYAQQQNGNIHSAHLTSQHQAQHSIIPQPHELDDPRMAMLKNSNSFPHNNSQSVVPSAGYPTVNTRSTYANGAPNWVPSQVAGFTPGPGHMFTPPTASHGLPSNTSASGSPVGGVSANGTITGSPTSSTSSLSSLGGGSPVSVVPSHYPFGVRRERSGSPSSQSAYELHHSHAGMQDFAGVPRMGGMGGGASFVPSHHHHVHGQGHGMHVQSQALSVGGGANAVMMMMM